jgi:hypothetical protein
MSQQGSKVQLRVSWGKCTGGNWCELNKVDLSAQTFDGGGVYIIWHGGAKPKVVYVGQAKLFRDRLSDHRQDRRIQVYADRGMYVTWAVIEAAMRAGVEAYLTDKYGPLVGERRPAATPIPVNSPWD